MHAWVEVGIHTYIYGRARLPRHDLVSCFQILHFRVHSWPTAKSHTQPLFGFSLLRDVEFYDDCSPIVLKEMSRFTLIALQYWSVYTNCRLFTHANSASKASVQLSALKTEGASAQDLPKYLIQLYVLGGASKIQNCQWAIRNTLHCLSFLFRAERNLFLQKKYILSSIEGQLLFLLRVLLSKLWSKSFLCQG